jgi:hypothetical protein
MTDIAGAATLRLCRIQRSEGSFYSPQVSEADVFSATAVGISARSDSKEAVIAEAKAAASSIQAYRRTCRRTAASMNARNGSRTSESFGRPL